MSPSGKTFESKRDWWVALLLWLTAAVMVAVGIGNFRESGTPASKGLMLVIVFACAALILWILYGTRYVVSTDALWVIAGPVRYRIPLESITSVTPTHSPLSSPACSLDRLRINYKRGRRVRVRRRPFLKRRVLVSPENKREFLDALAARATHLRRENDRLVTASE